MMSIESYAGTLPLDGQTATSPEKLGDNIGSLVVQLRHQPSRSLHSEEHKYGFASLCSVTVLRTAHV